MNQYNTSYPSNFEYPTRRPLLESMKMFWRWSNGGGRSMIWNENGYAQTLLNDGNENNGFEDDQKKIVGKWGIVRSDGRIISDVYDEQNPTAILCSDNISEYIVTSRTCFPSLFGKVCYIDGYTISGRESSRYIYSFPPKNRKNVTTFVPSKECIGCTKLGELYSFVKWWFKTRPNDQ